MTPLVLAALGALAPPAAVASISAPISQVTVYSDRARVTRTAALKPGSRAGERVELPLLGDAVDPSSIWVTARGGEVPQRRGAQAARGAGRARRSDRRRARAARRRRAAFGRAAGDQPRGAGG